MKEMTAPIDAPLVDKASGGKKNRFFFMFAPFVVTLLLLLVPVPEGRATALCMALLCHFCRGDCGSDFRTDARCCYRFNRCCGHCADQSVGVVQPGRHGGT